ncbi:pyrimidine/purine nucleoside phosphorylase [Verrucomicrobia bacterium]|nr:pyrimidine/purine nucleoside phosphorylase [Verrucomicrobiota bacterium]
MNFNNVNASAIANIYFDGKVVSHSLTDDSGARITLGLIYPGTYHFNTESPEKMEITSGSCDVTLDSESINKTYKESESFEVAGDSGFSISVGEGICQYVCTFLT